MLGKGWRSWRVHKSVVAAALNVDGCKVVAAFASVRGQEAEHVIHKLGVECLGRENLQQARIIELLLPKLELQETDGRVQNASIGFRSGKNQCADVNDARARACACVHLCVCVRAHTLP